MPFPLHQIRADQPAPEYFRFLSRSNAASTVVNRFAVSQSAQSEAMPPVRGSVFKLARIKDPNIYRCCANACCTIIGTNC